VGEEQREGCPLVAEREGAREVDEARRVQAEEQAGDERGSGAARPGVDERVHRERGYPEGEHDHGVVGEDRIAGHEPRHDAEKSGAQHVLAERHRGARREALIAVHQPPGRGEQHARVACRLCRRVLLVVLDDQADDLSRTPGAPNPIEILGVRERARRSRENDAHRPQGRAEIERGGERCVAASRSRRRALGALNDGHRRSSQPGSCGWSL